MNDLIDALIVELDKCGFYLWDDHWDHCKSGMTIVLLFSIVIYPHDRRERRPTKEPMPKGTKIFWIFYFIVVGPVYGNWAAPWMQ